MIIQLLVAKRPNMFRINEDPLSCVGLGALEAAFAEGKRIDGELTAYYPERYLNVKQQQNLIPLLKRLGCTKFSAVTISPLIIQNVDRLSIRIPCGEDDESIGSTDMCNKDYMVSDFNKLFI